MRVKLAIAPRWKTAAVRLRQARLPGAHARRARNFQKLPGAWRHADEAGTPPAAKEIAARARAGEAAALRTFELEGRLLGTALAQAVNLLNPARVILGGGVSPCLRPVWPEA